MPEASRVTSTLVPEDLIVNAHSTVLEKIRTLGVPEVG